MNLTKPIPSVYWRLYLCLDNKVTLLSQLRQFYSIFTDLVGDWRVTTKLKNLIYWNYLGLSVNRFMNHVTTVFLYLGSVYI